MTGPIVMHLNGDVFWRGPDGKDFIYWRRQTAIEDALAAQTLMENDQ